MIFSLTLVNRCNNSRRFKYFSDFRLDFNGSRTRTIQSKAWEKSLETWILTLWSFRSISWAAKNQELIVLVVPWKFRVDCHAVTEFLIEFCDHFSVVYLPNKTCVNDEISHEVSWYLNLLIIPSFHRFDGYSDPLLFTFNLITHSSWQKKWKFKITNKFHWFFRPPRWLTNIVQSCRQKFHLQLLNDETLSWSWRIPW